jgi:hypothetical protein
MPDYRVDQELVQFGEGSLTFLPPRFWIASGLPSGSYHLMARIELLSTATSTGRSLHDHVGLKVPGEAFLRL